jgi:hypothetical protein
MRAQKANTQGRVRTSSASALPAAHHQLYHSARHASPVRVSLLDMDCPASSAAALQLRGKTLTPCALLPTADLHPLAAVGAAPAQTEGSRRSLDSRCNRLMGVALMLWYKNDVLQTDDMCREEASWYWKPLHAQDSARQRMCVWDRCTIRRCSVWELIMQYVAVAVELTRLGYRWLLRVRPLRTLYCARGCVPQG